MSIHTNYLCYGYHYREILASILLCCLSAVDSRVARPIVQLPLYSCIQRFSWCSHPQPREAMSLGVYTAEIRNEDVPIVSGAP